MFFFTRLKKEFAFVSLLHRSELKCFVLLLTVLLAIPGLASEIEKENPESWSKFVPLDWQENIIMPTFITTMSIVSIGPAASGIPGHKDVTVKYTIKNSGLEPLNCIQIAFDVKNQIGVPPFVALTGSLSAMTGSGGVFGGTITGSSSMVFGGTLNIPYDGMMNDTLFNTLPTLQPDECISVNIPFEITDTSGIGPIIVSATTTGKGLDGSPVSSMTNQLRIVKGCRSISLACAGRVNVSLGPDCKAFISLNTVFLNNVPDTSRFIVEVFYNGINLGNMLDESHVGKALTYQVLDKCFNNRASCWGTIVLENKNIPTRSSTYQEIFCGEDPAPIGTLEDIIDIIYKNCFVNITSFQEIYRTSGDKCKGYITTRNIIGEYEIDGWKSRDTIHIDTIIEKALEIDMLEPPIGGPNGSDAIYVNCDSIGSGYPSPGFIKDYYDRLPATTGSGTAFAYPHINQGFILMEMYNSRDTIFESLRDTTLYIDSVWVNVRIIVKDTLTITDTTYLTKPDLVPIKTGTTCNLTVNYVDSYFAGCVGPESKILRSWKILNWCTGQLGVLNQWIIIEDDRGPDIELLDTVYVGVPPWTCTTEFPLTAKVKDNCSTVRSLNWKSSAGIIGEDNILRGISLEDNPISVQLQAVDQCGNDSTATLIIFVVDSIAPVAIARDQINTSLIYDPVKDRGLAKITKGSIDLGSHDSGCGPVQLCILLDEELSNPILEENGNQVKDSLGNFIYHAAQCEIDGFYKGLPYVICKDAVKLCCDQVGQHRVALIANDFSELSAPGYSWTLVNVEDKSYPIVNCEDIKVTCGSDINPEIIGYPGVSNGLCENSTLDYFDQEDVNDCGVGKIRRTWIVNGDTSCTQIITVEGGKTFDPRSIKWPKHYDDQVITGVVRECVNDTIYEWEGPIEMGLSFECGVSTLDEPVWCETTCSMLFMTYEDQEVEASEACKKIVRKWTVIDWCTYRPNSNNLEEDDDIFEAVSDELIIQPNIKSDLKEGDPCVSCDKPSSLEGEETFFRYTKVDVDGFYNFNQIIKIIDNTPPVVDAPEEVIVEISTGATSKDDDKDDCIGDIDVVAYALDLCGDILLDASSVRWLIEIENEDGVVLDSKTVFGDSAVVNSQKGMAGTEHTINWYITDGCGNEGFGHTIVVFKDILPPSPLCISELSTASMNVQNGGVTIWASDFDHGSYDNCSEIKTFFRNSDGVASASLTFTCDDIPDGVSTIKQLLLYVADEAGNESSCNVSIRLDDTNNVCIDSLVGEAQISGQIMTFKGDMIEAASVLLNGANNKLTDVNGTYAFDKLPMLSSYKIEGNKDDDPLNGVSTLDLVLIQRHILALDKFDSPYKMIAADINNDARISAVDLVQLRRLILGYTVGFPNNKSWRFIDPNQEFPRPTSPWPFTEVLIVYDLNQNMQDQNMLGIKIGDVSGNAVANSLLAGKRSIGKLKLTIDDQVVKKGETIDIPVRIGQLQSLAGLQFTIEATDVKIEKVISGALPVNGGHYAIHNESTLTMAWSDDTAIDASGDLFRIRITAKSDITLSKVLHLSDRITISEAYGSSYDPMVLDIAFEKEDIAPAVSDVFELLQNEPNPFNTSTTIGFRISEKEQATLTLMDISGRIIYSQTKIYPAGYHEVQLHKEDIPARGVIYYQLKTDKNIQTRKMILIE